MPRLIDHVFHADWNSQAVKTRNANLMAVNFGILHCHAFDGSAVAQRIAHLCDEGRPFTLCEAPNPAPRTTWAWVEVDGVINRTFKIGGKAMKLGAWGGLFGASDDCDGNRVVRVQLFFQFDEHLAAGGVCDYRVNPRGELLDTIRVSFPVNPEPDDGKGYSAATNCLEYALPLFTTISLLNRPGTRTRQIPRPHRAIPISTLVFDDRLIGQNPEAN